MNPFGWLVNLFRRGDDPARQVRYVLPYPVSGLNLSADETLSLSAVWACIDAITSAIASCKWNVYEPTGPNRRKRLDDDPLAYILNTRPNPDMTAIAFREAMLFQAIPFGNAYAEIVRDGGGRISQLWPLSSDRVQPRRNANWELVYDHTGPDGVVTRLEQSKVFHLRGPGLYGLMGDNVVARAAKSIGVAAAQERYSAAFFGQGAQPGGILKYPGELSDAVYARLQKDWAEKRKGPENAHKPMILEEGLDFTPTSIDPQKSQLVEARQFSVEEICRWFRVPPHKVQHLERATFSNIEHSSIEFVRDSLTPWAKRLDQEADFKLLQQKRAPWRYTAIDLRPLTAGDAAARASAYGVLRQNGIATANEIRELEGLDDCGDEGDVLLVQSNLTTVENILNPPKPAPAPLALDAGAEEDAEVEETEDAEGTEGEPGEAEDDDGEAMAAAALKVVMVMTLDRYARRLANRRRDLQRAHIPELTIRAHLNEERVSMTPKILEELEPANIFAQRVLGRDLSAGDLQRAMMIVENGEASSEAVFKVLPATCPRPG